MDLQLTGKRALVTGSSGGIGEAIAKTLAAEGAQVVVHGRREAEARRVVGEIASEGGQASVALGRLGSDEEARRVAEQAGEAFGGIDIVINNAGGYESLPWDQTSPTKWLEMFNDDVVSMVRMIGHFAPPMRARGWGRFVQISSTSGVQPLAIGPDYGAAKAAIINLSVSLAKDLAGTGVTANTVSPGPTMTVGFVQLWRSVAKQRGWGEEWPEIEKRLVAEVLPNPAGRLARVEEVAAVVALVASPLGGYINGANVRVDGGFVTAIN